MAKRIAVDPITRIEGHLRIEAEVEGGKITNAWSSSTAFRGIETILNGRDPVMPTILPSVSAECAPRFIPWPASVRWKMP